MSDNEQESVIDLATIIPLKTNTVPPYTTTNAVLYGAEQFIVVDPGPSDAAAQKLLIKIIEKRIARKEKFLGVYLSHHHRDHCDAAVRLREYFKVPIAAHEQAHQELSFPLDVAMPGDAFITIGSHRIEALYTPGHATSHMVYYDPIDKVLIAGDMLTDKGCVLIPPTSGSLRVYLQSMERLMVLPIKTLIPAHGDAIKDKAEAFVLHAILHRLGRIKAIVETLEQQHESMDATDITRAVYQGSIDEKLMFFAQLSVESSLQWLQEAGLAQKNAAYRWVKSGNEELKQRELLGFMTKIEERLRYA